MKKNIPQGTIPPFASLRAFEAVFSSGGIRKAASQLQISHAVVSRHVKALENWLGTSLLTRSGNRLHLTGAGEKYHARISAALSEISLATVDLQHEYTDYTLRICCVSSLSIQWLSGQVAQFERQHPEFDIELRPTDEVPDLTAHEADVDIRYVRDLDNDVGLVASKGIKTIDLARPEILAVAAPALAARLNKLGNVKDLLNEVLLHEENAQAWQRWLSRNGVKVDDKIPGPLCWLANGAIAAARSGRGVALASRFLIREDLARGDLIEIAVPGSERQILGSYMFFAREDRWSSPPIAGIRKHLRSQARKVSIA